MQSLLVGDSSSSGQSVRGEGGPEVDGADSQGSHPSFWLNASSDTGSWTSLREDAGKKRTTMIGGCGSSVQTEALSSEKQASDSSNGQSSVSLCEGSVGRGVGRSSANGGEPSCRPT
ncbi:hypothetical protein K525DRAFT_275593 [Schizophyllum commune Loenen D]|nr:hypothetical protein K525DRAFT_275593 [Schizophyllum commune Loenen D]